MSRLVRVMDDPGSLMRARAILTATVITGVLIGALSPTVQATSASAVSVRRCGSIPHTATGVVTAGAGGAVRCDLHALESTAGVAASTSVSMSLTCVRMPAVRRSHEARRLTSAASAIATRTKPLTAIIAYVKRERAWYSRHETSQGIKKAAASMFEYTLRNLGGIATASGVLHNDARDGGLAFRRHDCGSGHIASTVVSDASHAAAAAAAINRDSSQVVSVMAEAQGGINAASGLPNDSLTLAVQPLSGNTMIFTDSQLTTLIDGVLTQLDAANWGHGATQVGAAVMGTTARQAAFSDGATFLTNAGHLFQVVEGGLAGDWGDDEGVADITTWTETALQLAGLQPNPSEYAFSGLGQIASEELSSAGAFITTGEEYVWEQAVSKGQVCDIYTGTVTGAHLFVRPGQYLQLTFTGLTAAGPLNLTQTLLDSKYENASGSTGFGGLPVLSDTGDCVRQIPASSDALAPTQQPLSSQYLILRDGTTPICNSSSGVPLTISGLPPALACGNPSPGPPPRPPPLPSTTISVTSSPSVAYAKHQLTYSAAISGLDCGFSLSTCGTVKFLDNGVPIPECTELGVYWYSSQITCKITYAEAGSHSIVAAYSGDGEYSGSASGAVSVIVRAVPTCSPSISTVSQLAAAQQQTITIQGSCLGYQEAFDGDTPFIQLAMENAKGEDSWNAGNSGNLPSNGCIVSSDGDWVTLNVPQWTENEIVIFGFTGSYGAFGWILEKGEKVEVEVWNPLDEKGPACYTTSVG